MDVGDFQNSGLDRLDLVAEAWRRHDDRCVRGANDFDLVLPYADGLNNDRVETGNVQNIESLERRARQAAACPARRHRADVNSGVDCSLAHAHAIAQYRAAGRGARWIDRNDANLLPLGAQRLRELANERRFAGAGHAGDADDMRAAGKFINLRERLAIIWLAAFRAGNEPRNRSGRARFYVFAKFHRAPRSARAFLSSTSGRTL